MLDESIPIADQERIKRFVDTFVARLGTNPAVRPPPNMVVGDLDAAGWGDWKPIDSPISGAALNGIETYLGQPLPTLFKAYFQYQCLLRTDLCYPVRLPEIRSDQPLAALASALRTFQENRFFQQRRLFPCGSDCDDSGPICFALDHPTQAHDYPIIQVDLNRVRDPNYNGSQRWPSFAALLAEVEAEMLAQK